MTYSEAIEFLYSLRWFGAKFGLGITRKLAGLAGDPQNRLRFIHVAGTNGKGSTCAMLESVYRATGLRVGLFTSPHLVAFCERIQIGRRPIPETEVARQVTAMQPLLKKFVADEHPTFFEVVTVLALRYFAEQGCELVIWETGLGGRLDATNIVHPLASVITNIQYDHQKYLGETLASIATEKAGIIKPGIPVITGTDAPEALDVINRRASELEAPLTVVHFRQTQSPPLDTLHLPLLGEHQKMNAAVAIATIQTLASVIPCTQEEIISGLSKLHWPGRLQLATLPSGQKFLLDGAHNLSGAESLAAALKTHFPRAEMALILGILKDKDWSHMCQILAPLASRVVLVPVHSERTAEPHGLAEVCRVANPRATITECVSMRHALEQILSAPFVTVAGSLYLIGEAMELLGLSPTKSVEERSLNEWSAETTSARGHSSRQGSPN
ncbi:MAG TPA: folylpolyglutamate synthase/dihydrofolate synthase family protein [Verrucomicrobiae bacterium]|nr:folylpolyglutamate synthase/dihydrofolate synthase family protein [Verrucomicrobiae bacterium]